MKWLWKTKQSQILYSITGDNPMGPRLLISIGETGFELREWTGNHNNIEPGACYCGGKYLKCHFRKLILLVRVTQGVNCSSGSILSSRNENIVHASCQLENHHSDVIMAKKHQSSATLAFVWGIHRWPVNSPHKCSVTRKCFHLMT